ncbi:MAG: DUF4407 domain-containing protein [Saprospiraceae bacterium]|nr:DUF4407 domain-containing protein [Saprospiraceae bacterium]MCZ2339123.1 DUF4407 domain-containing protein [Chitinophagales bacterium]
MSSLLKAIRNRLCKLSGEDYFIISKCSNKIQVIFSLIGLLVLVILLCSFASALYFTEHLFHSLIADIGVGLVWGYIVTNMYVLLLYTISPTLLPTKIRKKQEVKTNRFQLTFSMELRIFIVVLLAVIIAQPLNVFVLKPNSTALAFDIKHLLATNPLATLMTLTVVAIFLLPVYLKYSIRKLGEFYVEKEKIEKRIITDDYKDFKKEYRHLLENNITNYNKSVWKNLMPLLTKLEGINPVAYQKYFNEISSELVPENIEKYEYWADPPFRTIPKSKTKNVLSEQDLLNHIYPEID